MTSHQTRYPTDCRNHALELVATIITSATRGAQAFLDKKAKEKKLATRDQIRIVRARGVRGSHRIIVDSGTSRGVSVEDLDREIAARAAAERRAYAELFARPRYELVAADT